MTDEPAPAGGVDATLAGAPRNPPLAFAAPPAATVEINGSWRSAVALVLASAALWGLCRLHLSWPHAGGRWGWSYGLVVGVWLGLQTVYAQLEHRRQRSLPRQRHRQAVSVVVPTFNEDPAALRDCLLSLLSQDYDGTIDLLVIDDGSRCPLADLTDLCRGLPPTRSLRSHAFAQNRGKREAQAWGFDRATGDVVVTVDSDTVLAPDALDRALDLLDDPRVGAVTGLALVRNRHHWLARLIDLRYWSAFCQERGSQSLFGVVTCCSGVFSLYRREILEELLARYLSQQFLGRPCTYGDDRHLTNLILEQGWEVRFAESALAWTDAPTSVRRWLRQQERWSKSFYREFLWTARFMLRRHWYLSYCLIVQLLLPFWFVWGLCGALLATLQGGLVQSARYLGALLLMAWLRGVYGLWRTGRLDFLLMPLYGLLHVCLIFPIRLRALATMHDTGWGTR